MDRRVLAVPLYNDLGGAVDVKFGGSWAPHPVNDSQRFGGGHVWPCLLDSLNGKHGLAHVVLTGCLGVLKSLPDNLPPTATI